MVDLVAKFTEGVAGSKAEEDGIEVLLVSTPHLLMWELYADGAAN